MRKYNGLTLLSVPVLALCTLASGCARFMGKDQTYPVNAPAQQPAAAAARPATRAMAPAAAPASAPAASLDGAAVRMREDAPLRYVVKKGDTLWGIANRFLLDSWQWPEIWIVNDKVANPHLIYPGDVLTLVYKDGRPMIGRDAVGITSGNLERVTPVVRVQSLEDAIPAIPIEAIRDFLVQPRIVTPEQIKAAPYVVDFLDPQINAGAGSQAYVKNLFPSPHVVYSIVRIGQRFVDPETGDELGWEAIPVGEAEVRDFGKVGSVDLVRTQREVRSGDYLLPREKESFDAFFYPKAPPGPVNGRILSVLDGSSQIGQYFVITINRGAAESIERGHVLNIMQAGRTARDPHAGLLGDGSVRLPDTMAGTAMVFKVMPRVSYALVMTATRPVHVLDKVVNPTSLR